MRNQTGCGCPAAIFSYMTSRLTSPVIDDKSTTSRVWLNIQNAVLDQSVSRRSFRCRKPMKSIWVGGGDGETSFGGR